MKPNLQSFDRWVRVFLGAFLLFAAGYFFQNMYARVGVALLGLWSFAEAFFAHCPLMYRLGAKTKSESLRADVVYLCGLCLLQLGLSYEWWKAGFEKISTPDFVNNIGGTLTFFASKNQFGWYADFLTSTVMQHATTFAYLIEYGELAVAVGLGIGALACLWVKQESAKRAMMILSIIALIGGAFLNANFYFAAGWTSVSTANLNSIMLWFEILLAYTFITRLMRAK